MYIVVMVACGIIILFAMIGTHRFFSSLMMTAIQGIIALFSVNFIGDFLNIHISLNWFSLIVGVLGGLPGIILLLLNNLLTL
ncbi:MAG: pro-sigmaK processing inhibitor BofA family protein [Clostridia bacterium]|nr:pro-sigmaK processing inhibitor BofA family protein [Clostridia bacterium]